MGSRLLGPSAYPGLGGLGGLGHGGGAGFSFGGGPSLGGGGVGALARPSAAAAFGHRHRGLRVPGRRMHYMRAPSCEWQYGFQACLVLSPPREKCQDF